MQKKTVRKLIIVLAVLAVFISMQPAQAKTNETPQQQNAIPESIEAGVTWLISVQNQQNSTFWQSFGQEYYQSIEGLLDGGWGFLPGGFPNVMFESDTLITASALWGLCASLSYGYEVAGQKAAVKRGVTYLLDQQERRGSWFSPLLNATAPEGVPSWQLGEYARTYSTTRAVDCLISFKTLVKAGVFRLSWRDQAQLQISIRDGLRWVEWHNLKGLGFTKATRDVADGIVVFEDAVKAGINVNWAEKQLGKALDWLINTQTTFFNMESGWAVNPLVPNDDIFHTSFAIAALAGSTHLPT